MLKSVKPFLFLMFIFFALTGSLASVSAKKSETAAANSDASSVIRLQYDTFDPLISEPDTPAALTIQPDTFTEAIPYIVQFEGPIQPEWKVRLEAAGAVIDNYLPDNAFLVRLDGRSRTLVAAQNEVRWVGVFQPAYKFSPRLADYESDVFQLVLASWADPTLVQADLAASGIDVSGNGRYLTIQATADELTAVARHPDILWIEPRAFFKTFNSVATGIMNAPTAWTNGYTGDNQIVTVADTGLDTGVDNINVNGDIHADFDNRVSQISSLPVINDPCITNSGANDGASDTESGHGTHVAGSTYGNGAASGGQYKGTAYEATITFQAIEQLTQFAGGGCGGGSGYFLTGIPNDLHDLFQEAYDWGSRIHTNSWGSDVNGAYTTSSQQADDFAWDNKNLTILFAAGNAGVDGNSNGYVDEDSMGSPATAKNVISIGASDNVRATGGLNPPSCSLWSTCWPADYPTAPTGTDAISDNAGELAAFSSRGPTDDGRIKPDLVAPGTNILSTKSSLIAGDGWGPFNADYMYNGGTSMATPLAAGGAAIVREYLQEAESMSNPSSALIKALLINTAVDINGYGNSNQEAGQPIPNNHEGWGRIDLEAATNGTNRTLIDDESVTTGIMRTHTFSVTNTASPLKVSLVWTDYQGNPAAGTQLVNDLNLTVKGPGGSPTYLGNQFSGGWSATGGSADTLNNVENVYIQSPTVGEWTIEVNGSNVPQGPQPFALVISGEGSAATPGQDQIFLPVILNPAAPGPTGPTDGFWESTTGDEFYVTSSGQSVEDFAIFITVNGCGNFKITRITPAPITNDQFSFTGAFYASGTFNSNTTASGTDGLTNYNIAGCGTVSGGPWNWNAIWKNSSPPPLRLATRTGPELITKTQQQGHAATVTPIP